MPNYHAWPDEVRSSPYADQLSLGFRRLRFSRALEREYRAHMLEDGFELKRIALCVATVIWLALTALDMLVVPASHLGWVIAVRLVVLVILLVCATLILRRRHSHLLLPLSMTCILVLGVGAAMIVGIAHRADPGYPYEGLLLVSMAAYFLVGLRLNEALACSLVILLAYVIAELAAGLPAPRLINNLLFLVFGNLIGAVGCYLLEYKSREHFLISHLMQLLAYHDSLTGLHNRRSFNRQFERLWRQAQRDGISIALLLCDIDHFKQVNDSYGHAVGDTIIRAFGDLIGRSGYRAGRIGGEEFALILPDCSARQAARVAETLRLTFYRTEHEALADGHRISASFGIAGFAPADTMDAVLLAADRALYRAKDNGRNRVVISAPSETAAELRHAA